MEISGFWFAQQNTKNAERITLQTGQAQTPSVSPAGKEFVYLSDSGGHGNLWIASTDGSHTRQITFEHDPAVVIGVPIWSPAGDRIVFILTREGRTAEWVVSPDGSSLRELVPLGSGTAWSPDGKWLYYPALTFSEILSGKLSALQLGNLLRIDTQPKLKRTKAVIPSYHLATAPSFLRGVLLWKLCCKTFVLVGGCC